MSSLINRIITLFTSLVILTAMAGCGGSGSDATTSTTTSGETGSVGVLLTDKPADPDLFSAINVSIVKAELLGADDGRVELFSGLKTYDLLQLRNESAPFTFSDNVPVGTYCKVRLTLADKGLELVMADGSDNEYPKLTGNRKLDLLARDCFDVVAGGSVTLQLDMAAGDSIHIVQKGKKTEYNFRPVVFIDVLEQDFAGKLVRLEGEIAAVDSTNNSLLLCKALTTAQSYDRSCVRVLLGEDSAFFDNLNLNHFGDARPLDKLLVQKNVGQPATVVGLFKPLATPYDDIDIPDDELPDLGDCRIWHPDWETSQQPLPGDCDDLVRVLPADAVLIDDDGDLVQDHRPLMLLDGLAVELGEFLSLDGEVIEVDENDQVFIMRVNPHQEIIEERLKVELQAGVPDEYNGTRILSKQGKLLDFTSLTQFRAVTVDGVLQTSNTPDDVLKSAVVIVDTEALEIGLVTGIIDSVHADGFILIPGEGETPCGLTPGELLDVALEDEVVITTLIITDESYELLPGGTPTAGQEVALGGECGVIGFSAGSVQIIVDQRSVPL